MGRLIYIVNISLDGYIADRDGNLDWTEMTPAVFSAILEVVRPAGTYLYGRAMYEMMSPWETAHLEAGAPTFLPGLGDLERDFANVWRAADKLVFSTTLTEATTARTRIERTLDVDAIVRLKATSDLTVGGAHIARAMLAANLVDDLHAFVHPVILGGGTSWLPSGARIPIELVHEKRMGRAVHLHYQRS